MSKINLGKIIELFTRRVIKMVKKQNIDGIEGLSEIELEEKIRELRIKLNKAIESDIDKKKLVNISQELDQYIVFKQQRIDKKDNK